MYQEIISASDSFRHQVSACHRWNGRGLRILSRATCDLVFGSEEEWNKPEIIKLYHARKPSDAPEYSTKSLGNKRLVVKGARPVTAELALLFGRALGQSPQYWLNLQATYDLKIAERGIRARLKAVSELESA
jgi:hypothetical protein